MDQKEHRSSPFAFPSGTSKVQAQSQAPASPVTSVASPRHRFDNGKLSHDVSDNPGDGLTKGLRYEAHRPRTPPKQVSRIGPGQGNRTTAAAAARDISAAAAATTGGKGVRAPRTRGALADLFPSQFADRSNNNNNTTSNDFDDRDIRSNSTATGGRKTPPDDAVRGASHDLSWTAPRDGRDGLVDQMLNTFDQLEDNFIDTSPSQAAPIFYADPDKYQIGSSSSSRTRRPRGHTYSSSTSSAAIPFQPHEALNGTGGKKHNRNKSSVSNFNTGLERVDSVRLVTDNRPSTQGATRARRLSKSSIVSGQEDAKPPGPPGSSSRRKKQQQQQVRRSASFDQSVIRSVLAGSTAVLRDPVTMNEYDDLNAAPEPSVRPGPRRFGESNTIQSVGSQTVRGRDNKDGGRTLAGLRRHGVSPQRINSLASDEPRNSSAAGYRDAPPISSSRFPPAASGYQAMAFSTNAPVGKDKEKGGFFKRMFGGGSSKTNAAQSSSPAPVAAASTVTLPNMSTDNVTLQRQHSVEQMTPVRGRQNKTQPSEERQQSVSSRHHVPISQNPDAAGSTPRSKSESKDVPTLNKKSSFFRRRKKSVASTAPAVPKLPDSSTWSNVQNRDHSPASSLRNVMTPYLSSRPGTRVGRPGSKDDRPADGRMPASPILNNFQGQPGSRDEMVGGTLAAAPRTSDSKPRRSTSRSQTRPSLKRGPHGDSTSSKPGGYELAHNDPDASELSDADFISAKSHVNSPVDEQAPDMFRPPAPTAAPPKVPAGSPKTGNGRFRHDLDPGKTPTHAPASVALPSTQGEGETVQPADEDYETGYRLFRFNSEPPTDDPSLPTNEDDICPWLGEAGPERARVRKAYLELFDWKDISILAALRKFCEHTRLKGETQQVDRVLEGIARRWAECNPSHGFKVVDVVHTICYSLLLLNTDLHLADIENRMTRGQFIKNTIPTVMKVLDDADPDAFKGMETIKSKRASRLIPTIAPPVDLGKVETSKSTSNLDVPRSPHSPTMPGVPTDSGTVKLTIRRNSNEFQKNKFRLSARPSDNYALENLLGNLPPQKDESETPPPKSAGPVNAHDDCGPLVKQPFLGGRTAWETQIETVLKNFYTSIQKKRLPLQVSESADRSRAPSSIGQNAGGAMSVRRTPSIASRQSDGRGRNLESRGTIGGTTSSRWTSRHRGNKPRIYAASSISVDDDMSMGGMSPSASSLWSKHSFGRTQTSMSVQSFGSEAPGHEAYQQSIGFANALSQAIIREEGGGAGDESDGESLKAAPLLEDESLELYGAPWAKEGTVKHKHHLEAMDKKAKERAWTECFAVIEKGWLRLFRFNSSKSASMRSKALRAAMSGVGSSSRSVRAGNSGQKLVVGGGNWMDNALPLGRFLLRQTIASALPPPGYSKSRPYVWALSLPNGAVHLFQANTPEIVREYVSCANYWSARLSKEPLTGGVSSLEYGWSESILGDSKGNNQPTGSSRASSRDGTNAPAASSSLAEVFNAKRQRSTSNSSATTQGPNIPARNASRSFARPPSAMHSSKPSLQTSIRSSIETTASAVGAVRPRLPGDQAKIADWTPPPQSMVASALLEVDQLRVLSDYVANVKRDLERHNELRSAIAQAYNPRHSNHARAMANFERKSAYLLREIVKFSTYVETLQTAQARKEEVYREREQRKRDLDDQKVEAAEELRRELSKSDLRKAAQYSAYDDDDDDVPEVPEVPKALMNLIT